MHGSKIFDAKRWRVGLHSLQIAEPAVFAARRLQQEEQGAGGLQPLTTTTRAALIVWLAVDLTGAALCTTWLVFELAPARRAKADCCGNCSCCIAPINAGTRDFLVISCH
ncbi:hypothetical protein OEZ85_012800 [Tetradesmus obliquus]|uniref:Uncharacterized protein n=1 Tax=Tetradesmus obliquus TaxID=3088 RepID=A0ABY8U3Z4_TETOB|nr:hypothetical protein OEZ85_012800 [Tetradesmus obliquus]